MSENETKKDFFSDGFKSMGEKYESGSDLLKDPKVKKRLVHVGAGLLAKVAFGLPGLAVVAANYYSVSKTGKSLLRNLVNQEDPRNPDLKDKIQKGMAKGKTLEEIQAEHREDLEDLYAEEKHKSEDSKKSQPMRVLEK